MIFSPRRLLILLLPALTFATTFLAGAGAGPVRVYWALCAVGVTFMHGFINLRKDSILETAREEAVSARANLAITVFDASQPVVATLQSIADADSPEDRRSAADILVRCTVGLAQTQLGHQSGIRCGVRAAFYRLDGDRLIRVYHQGRPGGRAPRAVFNAHRSAEDAMAVACARSEEAVMEDDLENRPPRYMLDIERRDYRSFISVPVRTPQSTFGLLTADSDKPNSLSEIDKGFLILLAGALAAGLAQLDDDELDLGKNTGVKAGRKDEKEGDHQVPTGHGEAGPAPGRNGSRTIPAQRDVSKGDVRPTKDDIGSTEE